MLIIIFITLAIISIVAGALELKDAKGRHERTVGFLTGLLCIGMSIGVLGFEEVVHGRFIPDGWYIILADMDNINPYGCTIVNCDAPPPEKERWISIEGENKKKYVVKLNQKVPLPIGIKTVVKVGNSFIPAFPPAEAAQVSQSQ